MGPTELCSLLHRQISSDERNVAKADKIVRQLRRAGEDTGSAIAVRDLFASVLRRHRRLLDEAVAKVPVHVVHSLVLLV
jgi:hypothetical protein